MVAVVVDPKRVGAVLNRPWAVKPPPLAGKRRLSSYTIYSMQSVPIKRFNLSDQVEDAVRRMILDGRLNPEERINEVRLAEQLGVSRTPLREALNRLVAEHAVINTPHLGYVVQPLTLEEFEQVYDVRPILDPEALRLAGVPCSDRLALLESINRRLSVERDPDRAIALDDEWHRELLADCGNRVLLELIEDIIRRMRRYELALMRETRNVLNASKEHERILRALRNGDLEAACAALKRNMQSGRGPIVFWLKTRVQQFSKK